MVAAVAQSTKETVQISEQESLQLTRNLLRIAIFNISYIRGLFPEKYFDDKFVPALEMKIKKLLPLDDESRRLIDWMERGVYDALSKKYLKTLVFAMCRNGEDDGEHNTEGKLLEEYTFSFSYGAGDSEVSMDITRKQGDKKKGKSFHTANKESTPADMKSSACKMVRTLVQLMRTLDTIPKERTTIMKLYYYDDVTPVDYEPPFFRGCPDSEQLTWSKNPLRLKVGNVDSKHYAISLKVRSVLDPCGGDGQDEAQDEASNDSDAPADPEDHDKSESSESDSDDESDEDMDIPEKKAGPGGTTAEKKQVEESHLAAQDHQEPNKNDDMKPPSPLQDPYSFTPEARKDRGPVAMEVDKEPSMKCDDDEDAQMYSKALFHTLSCEHITIGQLQSKCEVSASTAKKFIEMMVKEGYLEQTSTNRRQGRKVLHSAHTDKKLKEVISSIEGCKIEPADSPAKRTGVVPDEPKETIKMTAVVPSPKLNSSTCGVLESPGSDITRSGSKIPQGEIIAASKDVRALPRGKMVGMKSVHKPPPSPTMKVNVNATPEGSCSSPGRKQEVLGVKRVISAPFANFQDSQETHDEGSQRARKSSVVLDPIHQGFKRIRAD